MIRSINFKVRSYSVVFLCKEGGRNSESEVETNAINCNDMDALQMARLLQPERMMREEASSRHSLGPIA